MGLYELSAAHQNPVDVQVDAVAGLVAPGGRVEGGADVELVRQRLAHPRPHPRPRIRPRRLRAARAVLVLNCVENLGGSSLNNCNNTINRR